MISSLPILRKFCYRQMIGAFGIESSALAENHVDRDVGLSGGEIVVQIST